MQILAWLFWHSNLFSFQEHLRRCRRSDSQTEEPGITRGGKRQSMPHSVRFDPRGLRSGNRSNSTSQEALNSSPPAPMRSASFPAFLNYVGREEIPSEVVYRGSERSRSRTTSQIDIERESDIFTCTCGQRISRGQITSHMSEECPRRLTKCQYCRAQVKFEDMQVGSPIWYYSYTYSSNHIAKSNMSTFLWLSLSLLLYDGELWLLISEIPSRNGTSVFRISWSNAPPLSYRELYCDLEDRTIVQFSCDKGPTRF